MTRTLFTAILSLVAVGCGREYRDDTPTPPPPTAYRAPAPAPLPTATVSGRVTWPGDIPTVPAINGLVRTRDGSKWGNVPNHFAPKIDANSRAVAGAVVWLTGIDPANAKPWPYPPLTVEVRDFAVTAKQGETTTRVGFVRVGDAVTLSSADAEYQMIRARGATTFTLAFPTPSRPAKRKLDRAGHVEFTSGTGYFWSTADVFACEHPYFAVADAAGRFRFDHVPPGDYEAVAWLRNWRVAGADRDPETGRTMRLTFDEPFTTRVKVAAKDGTMAEVELAFPAEPRAK